MKGGKAVNRFHRAPPTQAVRARRHARLTRAGKRAWSVFRCLLFIGLGFVLLYPILYMVSVAFRPVEELNDPSVIWIPKTLTLANFPAVMEAMGMPRTLLMTILIAFGSPLMQMVACSLAGYGLARFRFPERGLWFGVVIFTILVPLQTLAIPSYINFKYFDCFGLFGLIHTLGGPDLRMNLLNTVWVYFLPSLLGMGLKSGLFVFVFRQFFRGLPTELEEAARIDGCGAFQTFARIMVPISGACYLTVFLFSLVWHWNEYYYSNLYMGGLPTMATSLASLKMSLKAQGVQIFDPFELVTRLQSGCLLMVTPLLLIYIFLQRYFIEGVERTGITG